MATTRYTVISGTAGTTLSFSNMPGVDAMVREGAVGGTGTITIETANALVGGRSVRFTKDTTNAPNYIRFDEPEALTLAFRLGFRLLGTPSANHLILNVRNAASAGAFNIGVTNGLLPLISNASGGMVWTGGAALSLNVNYRFEVYAVNGDLDGTIKARVVRESDSAVVASTATVSDVNMSPDNFNSIRIGAGITSVTNSADFMVHYFDVDMGVSDYLAPFGSQTAPTAAASTDGIYQFINASASAAGGSDTSVTVQSISPSTNTRIAANSEGDIGVFVPNTTQAYTLTIAGQPSGTTSTVNVTVTQAIGTEVNVASPKRPNTTADAPPGNVWY